MQFWGRGSGDWGGGLHWIALLFTNSSCKSAAPRLRSPKLSKRSQRSKLNWPSKLTEPNSRPARLSRFGRPFQNVAGQDGWQLARRLCQISRRVEQVFGPSRSQGRRWGSGAAGAWGVRGIGRPMWPWCHSGGRTTPISGRQPGRPPSRQWPFAASRAAKKIVAASRVTVKAASRSFQRARAA
jgi:hypothetical protein